MGAIRIHWLVISIASLVMAGFAVWVNANDLMLAYGDATSHLGISRRVVDNLTPGFGQLGSSWLPALHLLMLPIIWQDEMWMNGWAGAVVSGVAYVGAVWYGYNLACMVLRNRWWAAGVTVALFGNPNLLYLSSTAMNEALFVCSVLATSVYLLRWTKEPDKYGYLMGAAGWAFLTAANRYEGWFLVMGQAAVVWILSRQRQTATAALGIALLFAYAAFMAPALWLGWNWLIFGDPFEFLHNDYTSRGSQLLLEELGRLPTKGSVVLAAEYYFRSIVHMLGWIAAAISIAVALMISCFAFEWIRKSEGTKTTEELVIGVMMVPGLFLVYTLVKGVTALHLPEVFPFDHYNVRYGLLFFPAVFGLMVIFLREMSKIWRPLSAYSLIVLAIGTAALWPIPWPAVTEAKGEESEWRWREEIAGLMQQQYRPGEKIWLSAGARRGNPLIQKLQLPMNDYIHEGTQIYWQRAMIEPASQAEWIIVTDDRSDKKGRDAVMHRLLDVPELLQPYDLKYQQAGYRVYKLK